MRAFGTTPRATPRIPEDEAAKRALAVELDDQEQLEHIYLLRGVLASHEVGADIWPGDVMAGVVDVDVDDLQLNEKVSFAKTDAAAATAAAGDIAPELEKLRLKAVQKVKDFLLLKIGSLKVKKTNIQILQQNVLLKYARRNSAQFGRKAAQFCAIL